jgi:hypothetical protein
MSKHWATDTVACRGRSPGPWALAPDDGGGSMTRPGRRRGAAAAPRSTPGAPATASSARRTDSCGQSPVAGHVW